MALTGIIGHYEIVEILGSGAMGDVYKARDLNLPRVVALKVLSERLSRTDEARKRFDGEVNSATELSHENIVTIYDRGEHEGRPWFAMEFIDGADLNAIIRSAEPRSQERNLDLAIQICDALHSAHARGIIHRDLKPANVMVKTGGNREIAKLVDFGIVHREDQKLTQADTQPGTLSYMSPEQVNGEPIDWRSDLFSLGIVLYELFTGAHPFEAASEFRIAERIRRDEPVSMKKKRADISSTLDGLVIKLLEKDRAQRPQTAAEVAQHLRDLHRRLTGSGTSGGIVATTADEFIRASVEQMISEGRKREGDGYAEEALQWYRRAQDLDPGNDRILKRIREVLYRIESDRQFGENLAKSREALAAGALDEAQKFCNAAFVIRKESEDVAALQAEIQRATRARPAAPPARGPLVSLEGVAPPEDDDSRSVVDREIGEATRRLEAGDPAAARTILVKLVSRFPDYPLVEHMLDMVVQVEDRGIDVKSFYAARREAREGLEAGRLAVARSAAARALQIWPDNEEVRSISREVDSLSRKAVTDLLADAERLVREGGGMGGAMNEALTRIRTAMDKASEAEALGADPQTVRRIFDEAKRLHDVLYKKEQLVQGLLARGRREIDEALSLASRVDQERQAIEGYEAARDTFERVLQEDEGNVEAKAARETIDRQVGALEARLRKQEELEAEQAAIADAVRRRLDAVRSTEGRTADEVGLADAALDAAAADLDRIAPGGPQGAEATRLREDLAGLRARLADRREALRHREQTMQAHLGEGRSILAEIRRSIHAATAADLERVEALARDAEAAFGLVLAADADHADAKDGLAEVRSAAEHARDDLRRSREAARERDRVVADHLREAAERLSEAYRLASGSDLAELQRVDGVLAAATFAFEAVAALESGHDAAARGLEACAEVRAKARSAIEAIERRGKEDEARNEREAAARRDREARIEAAVSRGEEALEGARQAVGADVGPDLRDAADAIASATDAWTTVLGIDADSPRASAALAELQRLEASRKRLAEERNAPPPPAAKEAAAPPPAPPSPPPPAQGAVERVSGADAPTAKEIKATVRRSRELESAGKLGEALEVLETMEQRAANHPQLGEGIQDLRIRIDQVRAKIPKPGGSKKGLLIGGGIAAVAVVAVAAFFLIGGERSPSAPTSSESAPVVPEPEPPAVTRETKPVEPEPPPPKPEMPIPKPVVPPKAEEPLPAKPQPKPTAGPEPVKPAPAPKTEEPPKPPPIPPDIPKPPVVPPPSVGFEGGVFDAAKNRLGAGWKIVFVDLAHGNREIESAPTGDSGTYFAPSDPSQTLQPVRAVSPTGERHRINNPMKRGLRGAKTETWNLIVGDKLP